jgi:hypothetical protein
MVQMWMAYGLYEKRGMDGVVNHAYSTVPTSIVTN